MCDADNFRLAGAGLSVEDFRVIQRMEFSYEGIDEDVRRLGVLLREVLPDAGVKKCGEIAVLNVACGRADETGELAKALAPAQIGFYLGIDLRADAIAEAAARWEMPGGEIDFRVGNAAMIGRIEHLPEFDVVFIRHQNYWNDPMAWEGLLDEALAAMKEEGHLVCTSYFDFEHELLLASIREKGVRLLANVRNQFSRPLPDEDGKSVDRWVAVFAK